MFSCLLSRGRIFRGRIIRGRIVRGRIFRGESSGGELSGNHVWVPGQFAPGRFTPGRFAPRQFAPGKIRPRMIRPGWFASGSLSNDLSNIITTLATATIMCTLFLHNSFLLLFNPWFQLYWRFFNKKIKVSSFHCLLLLPLSLLLQWRLEKPVKLHQRCSKRANSAGLRGRPRWHKCYIGKKQSQRNIKEGLYSRSTKLMTF